MQTERVTLRSKRLCPLQASMLKATKGVSYPLDQNGVSLEKLPATIQSHETRTSQQHTFTAVPLTYPGRKAARGQTQIGWHQRRLNLRIGQRHTAAFGPQQPNTDPGLGSGGFGGGNLVDPGR